MKHFWKDDLYWVFALTIFGLGCAMFGLGMAFMTKNYIFLDVLILVSLLGARLLVGIKGK